MAAEPTQTVSGVVFVDENGNGLFDPGETVLPGVRLSNGRDIVLTDDDGRYELPIHGDANIFVIKPAGYRTPINALGLPRFFYLHRPNGSPEMEYPGIEPTGPLPERIDFPLYPQDEPSRFKVIMFGDPQPRNRAELQYILRDVIDELAGSETADEAAFGVSLGDLVFDDLSLFDELNEMMSAIGVPWYNVSGNHDHNTDAPDNFYAAETFQRVYGPAYYAFEYGSVHFIVLNNIYWFDEENGRRTYQTGLGEQQLEFLRNNLALVPTDQQVVLLMHIPVSRSTRWIDGEKEALFALLQNHTRLLAVGGHSHRRQKHTFLNADRDGWHGEAPFHSFTHGTVSGAWWRGSKDEYGIPHAMMADGTPTGYTVLTFDEDSYQFRFKAARRPADFQMHVHSDWTVEPGDRVLANIFNAMPDAVVGMKIGKEGSWRFMGKVLEPDPYFQEMAQREGIHSERYRNTNSPHLWAGTIPEDAPEGTQVIYVRGLNPNGQAFDGTHVVYIKRESSSTVSQ